jgi:uncharacterized protein
LEVLKGEIIMTKEFWVNLPVKDINRSRKFFTEIGFSLNQKYGNSEESASFLIGDKNVVLMLFSEPVFKGFIRTEISDTSQSTEVLFSIDAENREEVDALAKKVSKAGGTIFSQPEEHQGWMYGFGFTDPDDHRWNVLYMDMSKIPKG